MSRPTLKLPRGADELLRDFPLSEPDFDAQAKAIEARLHAKLLGVASDDVLRVPELEPESSEPAPTSAVHTAPAATSSFAEMARKSVQRKEEDDNAALAKELLAASSHARRPDAEMVARVRAAGKAAPTATPLPSGERTSGVVARAAAAEPAVATPAPTPAADKRGLVMGLFAAALAIAAGVALFMRPGPTDAGAPASTLTAQRAADAPTTPAATPDAARHEPSRPARQASDVLAPEALAMAPAVKPSEAKAAAKPLLAAGEAPPMASKSGAGGTLAKHDGAAAVAADDGAHSAKPTPTEAPAEPQMKPAEGRTASVPLNPSSGAVSTALGAVRSGAQACLAGQSEGVKAVVVFSSDGRVSSVSAAGPSGACIQAALFKAHLTPFAKDHFSATTIVRPP